MRHPQYSMLLSGQQWKIGTNDRQPFASYVDILCQPFHSDKPENDESKWFFPNNTFNSLNQKSYKQPS